VKTGHSDPYQEKHSEVLSCMELLKHAVTCADDVQARKYLDHGTECCSI
jgi:hypothetical protein